VAALTRFAAMLGLLAATPAHADAVDRWRPLMTEASLRFGIPTSWIERVMRAESAGMTTVNGRPIRSRVGAIGLMQLMPATWAEMRARLGLGADPDDPRDNILAGTCYLRLMYDRLGYPGLFAAYNAGPARYAEHLAGRRRLPAETIAYLATVGGASTGSIAPALVRSAPPLFVVRRDVHPGPQSVETKAPQPSVFAIVKGKP
jgi:soluble lytic murein transglycosylase-like protein